MTRSEPEPSVAAEPAERRQTPNIGDVVELEVTDLLQNGQGVGRAGGIAVFVWGPLPGERAEVRITLVKARYAVAELLRVLTESAERVAPFCPVFGTCGGCQLQHLSYPAQLDWKRNMLQNTLARIGSVRDVRVAPTIGMAVPRAYRNKAALVVRDAPGGTEFGFYEARSHAMVAVEACPVTVPQLDRTIGDLWRAARDPATSAAFDGALHVVVRVGPSSDEAVMSITTKRAAPAVLDTAPALAAAVPGIVGVVNSYDLAGENVVLGRSNVTAFGRPEITDTVGGLQFRVSAASFFQVNGQMLEQVFERLRPLVRAGSRVVDLYCGAGTFALLFASCGADVVGLEEYGVAVDEARANAERNGLAQKTRFIAGRVERLLQPGAAGRSALANADVVFLDPPRKGSDEATLSAIAAARVPEIWYLSCNPATLARDLAQLIGAGYALEGVQPFDMFPQTGHVEALATLRLAASASRGAGEPA